MSTPNQQVVTVELTWLDGQDSASVWVCTPDGTRVKWEGFIRLSAESLRSGVIRAVSTVVLGDLRRALFNFGLDIAGGDGADADAPAADQGAR